MHSAELYLNSSMFTDVGIFFRVRVGITPVGSVELALFLKHGFDFDIVFVKSVLVVPGNWSEYLEGSRMNRCLQRVPVFSRSLSQLAF